ncbi:hypothetical protein CW362_28415 [Streptomyces populi]|uniref:Uncharacterized protein n=1 Tax=Streptomyces populi TaxID=2058924 RepID=A0A2I0SIE1_9ACTN|nr:hypothetical protein [Streptomyces populi]PKT69682.1 hypothetical protein CW362_28415 [Streptomyces populi]
MNGSGLVFYVPGAILLIAVAVKAPSLKATWRDPATLPSSAILLIGSAVCVLSAPPTITAVNAFTGIANFSGPLVYSGMSALSAAYLVLMIAWRGGPHSALKRRTLLVVALYTLVIIGIVVLFALADVPVERTRDMDTYYAGTPYMREMILLYLVFHTFATVALTGMCLSWLRMITGITRTGLTLIGIGSCFDLSYQVAKYTSMAARWTGHDWDFLSTDVSPPLVATAGVLVAAGFALPRLGPPLADNVRAWNRYRLQKPLWAELRELRGPATAEFRWWTSPVVRLTQQEITILDGVLACVPYLDREIRDAAYAEALRQSVPPADFGPSPGVRGRWARIGTRKPRPSPRPAAPGPHPAAGAPQTVLEDARVVADAAMLAAARIHVTGRHNAYRTPEVKLLETVERPHTRVRLARAIETSPIVAAARRRAALQEVRQE